MIKKYPNSTTITGRIYTEIFRQLENNSDGVHWTDLLKKIKESNLDFHPKTINGCIWKLLEKYPDEVYKPEKGVFRLKKFHGSKKTDNR